MHMSIDKDFSFDEQREQAKQQIEQNKIVRTEYRDERKVMHAKLNWKLMVKLH